MHRSCNNIYTKSFNVKHQAEQTFFYGKKTIIAKSNILLFSVEVHCNSGN